jgi:uncharacterized protein YqjF (DUF2071 family)
MPRTFLTARWQDLVIVTYAVPRALLEPGLPAGMELDERDGEVFASLVAFDFRECRVRGVKVPGLVNFPEVNLRFYVRQERGGRRGVVFVREFVPSRVIAGVARLVYNEPYSAAAMRSAVSKEGGQVRVEHEVKVRGAAPMRIRAEADAACVLPGPDSAEHFFKEHSWGYGVDRRGRTLVYEVRHSEWEVHCNPRVRVEGDFAAVYGKGWECLGSTEPRNVVVALGSGVEVLGHAPHVV